MAYSIFDPSAAAVLTQFRQSGMNPALCRRLVWGQVEFYTKHFLCSVLMKLLLEIKLWHCSRSISALFAAVSIGTSESKVTVWLESCTEVASLLQLP